MIGFIIERKRAFFRDEIKIPFHKSLCATRLTKEFHSTDSKLALTSIQHPLPDMKAKISAVAKMSTAKINNGNVLKSFSFLDFP